MAYYSCTIYSSKLNPLFSQSVIFPSDTNDPTHLGNLAARSSSLVMHRFIKFFYHEAPFLAFFLQFSNCFQARVRVLSLIVKLFSISPHVASAVKNSGLLDLLEAEMKGTKDTLVILNVLELYYEVGFLCPRLIFSLFSLFPTFQRKILNYVECLCMCNAEVNGSGAQFRVRATNFTYSDVLFYHQV